MEENTLRTVCSTTIHAAVTPTGLYAPGKYGSDIRTMQLSSCVFSPSQR